MIDPLVPGKEPSMMSAKKGNELIDILNQLLKLTIKPDGIAVMTWAGPGGENATLTFTTQRVKVCVEVEGVDTEMWMDVVALAPVNTSA